VLSLVATVGLNVVLAPRLAEVGVAIAFAAGAGLYVGVVSGLNRRVIRESAPEEVHS
jgi:hypothetical protein